MCVYVFFNNHIFKKIQNINEVSGIYSQSFGQKTTKWVKKMCMRMTHCILGILWDAILPPIELIG